MRRMVHDKSPIKMRRSVIRYCISIHAAIWRSLLKFLRFTLNEVGAVEYDMLKSTYFKCATF
jgi:hypothetical protein